MMDMGFSIGMMLRPVFTTDLIYTGSMSFDLPNRFRPQLIPARIAIGLLENRFRLVQVIWVHDELPRVTALSNSPRRMAKDPFMA